jgi:hypothetical protein
MRNIPTIKPRIPINIDHTLTMCYQSNTINVHDNKDGIFEFSIRVLLALSWRGVGLGLFQNLILRDGFINFLVNRTSEFIQEKTWVNGLH